MINERSLINPTKSSLIRALRESFVAVIPILMMGSVALIIYSFPVPAYQRFITSFASGIIYNIFLSLYNATFGLLSVYMAASIGHTLVKGDNSTYFSSVGAQATSVAAFLISVGFLTESFDRQALSASGMLTAVISASLASLLYRNLIKHRKKVRAFSDGADFRFNNAVASILPTIAIGFIFSMINGIISLLFKSDNFWLLSCKLFTSMFENIGTNFTGGLLYVGLSSLMWFFGIHGSDVLESVNLKIFEPALNINAAAIAAGKPPTQILTKTFFDIFVLIGGCGTLLALVCSLLLFSRLKNNRSIAKMSFFLMLFNINEIMVFGLPIIYNPIMLVPFILTPIVSFTIAYGATALGLVPYTGVAVEWTTPIILGGYRATGSVWGAVLQLVILAVGILIYMPFVKIYDRIRNDETKNNLSQLIKMYQKSCENREKLVLTELGGIHGSIAKQLAGDLKAAIEDNMIEMFYQPQCDASGVMVGAEALLRWNHPVFGMIYPPLIIQLASEAGVRNELEKHIFLRVKRDLADTDIHTIISINATPEFVGSKEFSDFISKTFPDATIGNARICIEITEQSELINNNKIREVFELLKQLGFKLAIDDFSMGFTSIKYLSENNFDTVKLDGALVKGLDNPRNKDIIASIVYLSESLGFSVLAECVESVEQRKALEKIGCRKYQGYLYSRPIPIKQFLDYSARKQPAPEKTL